MQNTSIEFLTLCFNFPIYEFPPPSFTFGSHHSNSRKCFFKTEDIQTTNNLIFFPTKLGRWNFCVYVWCYWVWKAVFTIWCSDFSMKSHGSAKCESVVALNIFRS